MTEKDPKAYEKALEFCEKVFNELVVSVEPPYRNCAFGGLVAIVIGSWGILTESQYMPPWTYVTFFAVGLAIMFEVAKQVRNSTSTNTNRLVEMSAKEQIDISKKVIDKVNPERLP